jgi:hypothetical protein
MDASCRSAARAFQDPPQGRVQSPDRPSLRELDGEVVVLELDFDGVVHSLLRRRTAAALAQGLDVQFASCLNLRMLEEPPQWKKFENLAADIQRQLSPDARVQTNVKMIGKRSGTERQIDILVEQEVGPYSIRIVIDCKDYKEPVDVKDIEMFMGLAEDVSANKGAIITTTGFTSTAKKRAKDAGIDTYRLVDTSQKKWNMYLSLPAVVYDRYIEVFSFRFSATGYVRFPNKDPQYLPIYRSDGTLIDYMHNLVLERWEAGDIPNKPGEYHDIPVTKEETFVKVADQLYRFKIGINATVAERLYFGQVPIQDTRGFRDEQTGDYIFTEMITERIHFDEIEEKWEKIGSVEQLAIKPVLTLNFTTNPRRFTGPA